MKAALYVFATAQIALGVANAYYLAVDRLPVNAAATVMCAFGGAGFVLLGRKA